MNKFLHYFGVACLIPLFCHALDTTEKKSAPDKHINIYTFKKLPYDKINSDHHMKSSDFTYLVSSINGKFIYINSSNSGRKYNTETDNGPPTLLALRSGGEKWRYRHHLFAAHLTEKKYW